MTLQTNLVVGSYPYLLCPVSKLFMTKNCREPQVSPLKFRHKGTIRGQSDDCLALYIVIEPLLILGES